MSQRQELKKLNHIWVFSDSITGHEIQSIALAQALSSDILLYHCSIRQPWLSFAPRLLPRLGRNIIWKDKKPKTEKKPDAIITCGRRMAAIGKYYKRKLGCKHIQILNPGDNPKNYDILICPQHDKIKSENTIATQGSLHNITPETLAQMQFSDYKQKTLAVLIGNPHTEFFNQLKQLSQQLQHNFPQHQIKICASRRTPKQQHTKIKQIFKHAQTMWLNEKDGENPYLEILAGSDVLVVTADSINMVSESCATDKPVIAIAQSHLSPKHHNFIQTIQPRLSVLNNIKENNEPLNVMNKLVKEVIKKLN